MSNKSEIYPWHEDVQNALSSIHQLIEEVVRREQHRNDLTHLPNERALDRELEEVFEKDTSIWCAFIEIDHFKKLNDNFTYEAANGMLQKVAKLIGVAAEHYFLRETKAFHAHGDEFYLVGDGGETTDKIESGLNALRAGIAEAHTNVDGFDRPMQVTVTVGWAHRADLQGEQSTAPGFKRAVEETVAYGKRKGRNRLERYSESMQKQKLFSERGNCGACEAAFTMDVIVDNLAPQRTLWCPNCGETQPRSVRPQVVDATGA